MSSGSVIRSAVLCLIVGATFAGPSLAAGQSANAPQGDTIQQRLDRIAADLTSGAGHLADDIREAKAILAIDPQVAQAHMLLGMLYRASGKPELLPEAKAEFQQALDLRPDLLTARFLLAQTYFDLGRFDRAREELNTSLEAHPGEPQLLTVLAETERRLGNPRRAADLAAQALRANGSLFQAHYYLGLALLDLHQQESGIRELELVTRTGVNLPEVYLALGAAYVAAGRLDDAISTSEQGLRIAPSTAELRLQLARAYRLKGALGSAEAQLSLVEPSPLAIQPTVTYQRLETDLQVEWGQLRLAQGQLAPAAAALDRALAIDPNSGPAHRYLAEVLLRQGLYSRALEHAVKAEKLGSPIPPDQRKLLDAKAGGGRSGGRT